MQNQKNSSKPTWVPFNTWEAQQKALVKAKLEARKKQKEEEEKAKREAMFKPYNWGTHSGKWSNFAFSFMHFDPNNLHTLIKQFVTHQTSEFCVFFHAFSP